MRRGARFEKMNRERMAERVRTRRTRVFVSTRIG